MTEGKTPAAGPVGSSLRASGKDGPQIINSKGKRWTDEAELLFLDALGATCNVTASARAAGFSTEAIHRRRRRDAGFAQRWAAALEQGYVRLETAMIRRATEAMDGLAADPDSVMPPVTFAEAINLLRLHRAGASAERAARGGGSRRRPRSLDEVRRSIMIKLEAVVAMREEDAADDA